MAVAGLQDRFPVGQRSLFKPGGGQDHLGLGPAVKDRILPRVSPGINVLRVHPRYWSFYSFVLSEFWKRGLSSDDPARVATADRRAPMNVGLTDFQMRVARLF